jgi:hypothetical protein
MEYTVVDIGDYTLTGMRVNCLNGKWKVDDVSGHEVVVNYENCLLSEPKLAAELRDLYEDGAVGVKLVKWIPEHQRMLGNKLVTIPRRRADA